MSTTATVQRPNTNEKWNGDKPRRFAKPSRFCGIRENFQVYVGLGLEEKQNVPTEIKLTLLNLKIVASYYSRFPKSICFRYGLSLESVKSSLDKLPFVISDRTIL